MVLINKELPTQRLLVTISDVAPVVASPVLSIQSPFNGKTFNYLLGENVSPFKQRYDEFHLDTDLFQDLQPGKHTYTVKDGVRVLERGVLMVLDNNQTDAEKLDDVYTTIPTEDEDDDYIVYEQ